MCNIGLDAGLANIFYYGTCLLTKGIVPVLFALGITLFVWGVVNFFIIGAGEEAKRTQGKQFIIWGIIAFAVLTSVWGIVRIFGNSVGVNTRLIPGVRPSGSSLDQNSGGGNNRNTNTTGGGATNTGGPGDLTPPTGGGSIWGGGDVITPAPCASSPDGCGGDW